MSFRNALHSTLDTLRDRFAPVSHSSTFRATGQITPEEFVAAGDYLTYKFPTWSWADAATPAKRVAHLPAGKQYLVTYNVPCSRRLGHGFAGPAGEVDRLVHDELGKTTTTTGQRKEQRDDDGWLHTGGELEAAAEGPVVQTISDSGEDEIFDAEQEIPDLDDDEPDDEVIIPSSDQISSLRTYTLYITYTPYYRTPRLYLSGSFPASGGRGTQPIPPKNMMEDIMGDYADKTVTLEEFPFFDFSFSMASVHPCKHASVMKVLLDRADAALQLRQERLSNKQQINHVSTSMEGLVDQFDRADLVVEQRRLRALNTTVAGDEWDLVQEDHASAANAIRVDQYLVVFLKFMASVMPGMNYDFTMAL